MPGGSSSISGSNSSRVCSDRVWRNRQLRAANFDDLRFSILQRTSPDLEASEVIALEASWKARLHTREFGLNLN